MTTSQNVKNATSDDPTADPLRFPLACDVVGEYLDAALRRLSRDELAVSEVFKTERNSVREYARRQAFLDAVSYTRMARHALTTAEKYAEPRQ